MDSPSEEGVDQVLAGKVGQREKPLPRIGGEEVQEKLPPVVLARTLLFSAGFLFCGIFLGYGSCVFFVFCRKIRIRHRFLIQNRVRQGEQP